MAQNGYILVDVKDLTLDGVENTLAGVSGKIKKVYDIHKPLVLKDLTLKKELTGLDEDVYVPVANATIAVANDVYVITTLIASMNININVTKDTNKYKGIKF